MGVSVLANEIKNQLKCKKLKFWDNTKNYCEYCTI